MIAQLKDLSSYEIDEDLTSYTPEVFDNFELTFLASIGVNGTEGADLFQFEICTPKSLSDRCEGGGHYKQREILLGLLVQRLIGPMEPRRTVGQHMF